MRPSKTHGRARIARKLRARCGTVFGAAMVLALMVVAQVSCERAEQTNGPAPGGPAARAREPRLAVLSPAVAALIERLGRANTVVGRHGFDLTLSTDLPVVGDQSGLNYEALLEVEPTDVILEESVGGVPPRLVELAREREWRITTVRALTLDDVREMVRIVDPVANPVESGAGGANASPGLSASAVKLLEEMERAWGHRPELAARAGRTVILLGLDPPWAMGPGCFHTELIESLGLDSVPDGGGPSISMSVEGLLELDADTVIVLAPGLDDSAAEALRARLGEMGLRAAAQHRVVLVRDPLCLTPSPAMIELAETIAEEIGEWAEISDLVEKR